MAVNAPELRSVFFELGRKVRVRPLRSERSYHCFVEDVPNGSIHLSMPMEGRGYAMIPTGERLQLAVERRGNLYLFESVVTGRRFGNDPLLIVKRPPDHAALQRRQHVRVPVLLEGTLWRAEADDAEREREIPLTIVDVSAGGVAFRAKEHLGPGTTVVIEFALPADVKRSETTRRAPLASAYSRRWPRQAPGRRAEPQHRTRSAQSDTSPKIVLMVTARVVHCAPVSDEPEPQRDACGRRLPRVYRAGVAFVDIGDVVRERIIRFVMRREVELRCRGLI